MAVNKVTGIRISDELKAQITEAAKNERRSFSNYVAYVLEQHLKMQQNENK